MRIDRHAIGAARHHAVLDFRVGIEFARQEPADDEQHHDDAERDQRRAAVGAVSTAITIVIVGHGTPKT